MASLILFLFLYLDYVSTFSSNTVVESEEYQFTNVNPKCEKIRIKMCADIQYNMTIYPNLLKHTKQEEAESDIEQLRKYEMLVNVQCSPDIKFFLCTIFTPVCTILNEPIPPCRHLCYSAKNGCETIMRKFGYPWPEIFDCEKLPHHKDAMCVGENNNNELDEDKSKNLDITQINELKEVKKLLECPHAMKVLGSHRHFLFIANQTLEQCSLPCHNDGLVPTFFTAHIRHYLKLWTGAWAVTCCVCCLFTIFTFLVDLKRYEFPERAILFMAFSYFMVSSVYMVGLVTGDQLSCATQSATKQPLGNENFWCSALALAHFYFSFAGSLWWLILCFSWFLVTTLKWGEVPVGQVFSSYFNAFAWLLPLFGVIFLIIFGGIDGDVFTGICSVGNLQPSFLFNFNVLPQILLIVAGLIFFSSGFVSILRIRSYIKCNRFVTNKFENAEASEKLGRIMLRITCFSLLYVLPMFVSSQRAVFGFTQQRDYCPITDQIELENQPGPLLFFLKYLANFTVGIACAVWTLNGKTVVIYGEFMSRLCMGKENNRGRPTRLPTRVH
uniref:Frizzled-4 n=1 Tax=Meloidogyne javanica TaxID=6303 RepID=A0A915LX17_MELJA